MNYQDYLTTPKWHKKAGLCVERAGYRCQICNSPYSLQAHHRTYQNVGEELPGDLVCLCDDCHKLVSARLPDHPYKYLKQLGWNIQEMTK